MPTKQPGIKHIEGQCTYVVDGDKQCPAKAFVQVVVVDDEKLQKRIDAKASKKVMDTLELAHREGDHD